jgi:hypothetical protein
MRMKLVRRGRQVGWRLVRHDGTTATWLLSCGLSVAASAWSQLVPVRRTALVSEMLARGQSVGPDHAGLPLGERSSGLPNATAQRIG